MSIGRDDVLHVARLAELAVQDADLDRMVAQLNRIVEFVARLDEIADEDAPPLVPGPSQVSLRADVPGSVPLARPPADFAPEFADGFFLVPRHGAMEEP